MQPQPDRPVVSLRTGIQAFRKRRAADCGIACLKMLTGLPYDEVARAVHLYNPHASRNGVWMRQLQKAAASLGVKLGLRHRKEYDLHCDTGILRVHTKSLGHAVVLAQGIIIDPDDCTVQSADAYLKEFGYRPSILLVRE